jgi:hypothetical protein
VEPEIKPAAELAKEAEPVMAAVPEDGDDGMYGLACIANLCRFCIQF